MSSHFDEYINFVLCIFISTCSNFMAKETWTIGSNLYDQWLAQQRFNYCYVSETEKKNIRINFNVLWHNAHINELHTISNWFAINDGDDDGDGDDQEKSERGKGMQWKYMQSGDLVRIFDFLFCTFTRTSLLWLSFNAFPLLHIDGCSYCIAV